MITEFVTEVHALVFLLAILCIAVFIGSLIEVLRRHARCLRNQAELRARLEGMEARARLEGMEARYDDIVKEHQNRFNRFRYKK
jgi:hypothetical protein